MSSAQVSLSGFSVILFCFVYVYCVESFAHIECYGDCSRIGGHLVDPFATVLFNVCSAVTLKQIHRTSKSQQSESPKTIHRTNKTQQSELSKNNSQNKQNTTK